MLVKLLKSNEYDKNAQTAIILRICIEIKFMIKNRWSSDQKLLNDEQQGDNNILSSFHQKLRNLIANKRILVLGDVMLDSYVYGRVERISQEAPIPVLLQQGLYHWRAGGAANVAYNILALGGRVMLMGMVGKDQAAENLKILLRQLAEESQQLVKGASNNRLIAKNYEDFFLLDDKRPTTQKTRFIAQKQQILRLDYEDVHPISETQRLEILSALELQLQQTDIGAVILSDYGKGLLQPELLRSVIKLVQGYNCPIVIDPKGLDFSKYQGADYITPNRQELHQASGMPVGNDAEIIAAAEKIISSAGIKAVLATRSEQGVTFLNNYAIAHFHTDAQEVFDVAGAGDTVVAVFAVGLAMNLPPIFASRLANAAGGVVVAKSGTATASLGEIIHLLSRSLEKIDGFVSLSQLLLMRQEWREQKLVLANGCFDLLHQGHVALLRAAKKLGDVLVVAINSDESVQALKGMARPIQPLALRADALLALPEVDWVVAFNEITPLELIKQLQPDILVKGEDYKDKKIVGSEFAGKTELIKLVDGFSTSNIVKIWEK